MEPVTGSFLGASDRPGANSWAQNRHNVQALRTGDLLAVRPVTLELAPTNVCNLGCPGCPYGQARRQAGARRARPGHLASGDDVLTMRAETARLVLRKAREAGVTGVLWTGGGEPLLFEPLLDCLQYAADQGLLGALYTNGVRIGLDAGLAGELLEPSCALTFIRVPINAVSDRAVRHHWGARPELVAPQLEGLRRLFTARQAMLTRHPEAKPPAIQVSTILNSENVADLPAICEAVAGLIADARVLCDDAVVVRPMVNHQLDRYDVNEHAETMIRQIIACCALGGGGERALTRVGMPVVLGFGLDRVASGAAPSYMSVLATEYRQRSFAWAQGMFLTVGPDAHVYFATEKNCQPAWAFGDLKNEDLDAIYTGARRRSLLRLVHSARMGPRVLEPHTRMSRLNRIADQLQQGKISTAEVERIRRVSLNSPPLLLS